MIPKETREFLAVPKRHPIAFSVLYLPVIAGVTVASLIFEFTFVYTIPLLWCFFVSLFLIRGLHAGQLTDNHGTASRERTPARFWGKMAIWSAAYILAAAWSIGFAVQEQNKNTTEPSPAGDVLHAESERVGRGQE